MAPTLTPSSTSKTNHQNHSIKTPQSKQRLNFNSARTPNPNSTPLKETSQQGDHPIEVIGRVRDYIDKKDKPISSILHVNPENNQTLRVRADIGYRDFSLDGISFSDEEDIDSFYKKFVESRISSIKLGNKCTIMMYGPTGSGKSHTMFGCSKQPGIVYKALKDILGESDDDASTMFVHVTVLEIYNEEIYDLLSTNCGGGGFGFGWPKGGSASKARLEVMGKKAKNATYISGTEAGKISKEIQKVEKRRIVKSTLCNERSSRSHCMVILDVPTVGGRLMLVDMAGSENIEAAGQNTFEAKMQTAKINQGNIALKRVVESIANGDSHVPFRDSKLTMLLQDSFEDDKSKILMILCASPDPKEIHKTICTLEYGAKAKCIVRGPHTPNKVGNDESSAVILGSKITAMDQFICKLQMENKQREKERNEAHKLLKKKEEEVSALRALINEKKSAASEEEINSKVNERTESLKVQLEKKLEECQRMAEEFVESERRRMEERIMQQQQEVEMLRRRLEEIESELNRSRDGNDVNRSREIEGSSFARKLLGAFTDDEASMVKSMDLDMSDQDSFMPFGNQTLACYPHLNSLSQVLDQNSLAPTYGGKVPLSTVFEEEEVEEDEQKEKGGDEVVEKEVIEVKRTDSLTPSIRKLEDIDSADAASSRRARIENIFTLCGNYRELSQNTATPAPTKKMMFEDGNPEPSPLTTPGDDYVEKENLPIQKNLSDMMALASKGNQKPLKESNDGQIDVHVKWEASKGNNGRFITTLKVVKEATLADLRKLIDIYLAADNQGFSFLVVGDPTGAPVPKEKESTVQAIKLPICNNQTHGYLACLRPANYEPSSPIPATPLENKMPLQSVENKLPVTPSESLLSPKLAHHLNSTPFITLRTL